MPWWMAPASQRGTETRSMVEYLARGKTVGVLHFVGQKLAEQQDQHIEVGFATRLTVRRLPLKQLILVQLQGCIKTQRLARWCV